MKHSSRWITTLVALALALAALPAFAAEAATGKVNVNTASASQLALLPRVGPAVAQRIVEHREANGAFKSLEDLMLVRGIGEKTFELLAPYVALSGETTLQAKVRAPRPAEAETEDGQP
jgi:competence protein ComEA